MRSLSRYSRNRLGRLELRASQAAGRKPLALAITAVSEQNRLCYGIGETIATPLVLEAASASALLSEAVLSLNGYTCRWKPGPLAWLFS